MSLNNRRRWLVPWKDSQTKPVIYHCISRVVGRGYVMGADECERFRMLMRRCERFTGCRVLSYCLMSNHFHLLLEVPPMPAGGLSEDEFFDRLRAFYGEGRVEEIRREIVAAGSVRERGAFELPPLGAGSLSGTEEEAVASARAGRRMEEIRSRYTRRMHDLSEFMKALLERFSKWFNRRHSRSGHLWEDRFKSVIVESGTAARSIAAYIDLNPVRAGIASDPAEYRWSSYGEALGGGQKGNGNRAREGLVRVWCCDRGPGFEPANWDEVSRVYRRLMGLALGKKVGHAVICDEAKGIGQTTTNTAGFLASGANETVLKDLGLAEMLRCRVRYFTDGAVIGSKDFVNELFYGSRERFGPKRKNGARTLRGTASAAVNLLWSMRDLRKGVL
jgi:putative transposase